MAKMNILVVGAGVSGLTTAYLLLKEGHDVTLLSKEPAHVLPLTSANAHAIWVPVISDKDSRIEGWGDVSLSKFEQMAKCQGSGVHLHDMVKVWKAPTTMWYEGKLRSRFQRLPKNLVPFGYSEAHIHFRIPVIDPPTYLVYLRQLVVAKGGRFVQRELASPSDVPSGFDAVVNCTGVEARKFVNDATTFPQRVQVVRIKPRGYRFNNAVVIDEDRHTHIVPHPYYIKLGIVAEARDENLTTDPDHTMDILRRASRLGNFDPGLTLQDVIPGSQGVIRALRPEREGDLPRVEGDQLPDGTTIVHNYGHDGCGYVWSWGCAAEVVRILKAA